MQCVISRYTHQLRRGVALVVPQFLSNLFSIPAEVKKWNGLGDVSVDATPFQASSDGEMKPGILKVLSTKQETVACDYNIRRSKKSGSRLLDTVFCLSAPQKGVLEKLRQDLREVTLE